MKKIKKILCPIDFSDTSANAFRYALWFADKYGASIELLHTVFPEMESMDYPVLTGRATKQKQEIAAELMETVVETGIAEVQAVYEFGNIPDLQASVEIGVPHNLIAEFVEEQSIDMVIMGTEGQHNALERTFGSVTTKTINRVGCPVCVIPEQAGFGKINSIAYATDLTEAAPFHIWETGKILYPFHPIMRIVHISDGRNKEKGMTLQELEDFFKDHPPSIQLTFHNISAQDVAAELTDLAEVWKVDLLVMYKPDRSFIERVFHKSLTESAAFMTQIPLLIVR